MTARRMIAVTLVAAGIVVAGCSVTALNPEQEEEAYFLRVAQAEAPWLGAIKRFDRTLSASYSTRTAFLVAMRDVGLGEGAEESLEAARTLSPPDSLVADHERWLTFRKAVGELAPELAAASVGVDVPMVLTARRSLGEAEAEFLLSIGRDFCIHLAAVNPAEDCPPDESLPGGEYGAAAYEALREYAIRVGPLFLTSGDLDPGERTLYLAAVQPEIEALLRDTGERLSRLTPPGDFVSDHQALLSYFDDQYAIAVAITGANVVGDDPMILELYARSSRLFDALQETLSDAVRPIVAPAF